MSFRLDALPKSANNAVEGPTRLTLTDAKMTISQSTGREQMEVHFAIENGGNLREYYQVSESPFMMFKLRRFIEACDIRLGNAEVKLQDIAKMAPRNHKIGAILKKNDRGYSEIDYSDANGGMGLYPHNELFGITRETAESLQEIVKEQGLDINSKTEFEKTEPATAVLEAIENVVIENEDF